MLCELLNKSSQDTHRILVDLHLKVAFDRLLTRREKMPCGQILVVFLVLSEYVDIRLSLCLSLFSLVQIKFILLFSIK